MKTAYKEDILFIHCKPCVVLSELGVDGLGGELNKSVQLNKSVSVLYPDFSEICLSKQ